MQASRLLRTTIIRTVQKRNATYTGNQPPLFGYNDLPTPQGNWQTQYDARQRKYNMHLLLGVGTFVASIIYARVTNCLQLHYYPPDKPDDS